MSLKFLAVGQSVAGLRSEKSSYSWRKENQLPTFVGAPRFKHGEKTMVQTDWLQTPKQHAPAPEVCPEPIIERQMPSLPAAPAPVPQKRKSGWFSFLRLKWFRTTRPKTDLVQSELTLEKVQPVRNDLADSDLRLVLKRKKKRSLFEQDNANTRGGWTELTAKLFELGQK